MQKLRDECNYVHVIKQFTDNMVIRIIKKPHKIRNKVTKKNKRKFNINWNNCNITNIISHGICFQDNEYILSSASNSGSTSIYIARVITEA